MLCEPVVSCGAKIALAPAKKPLTMTPVHRPQNERHDQAGAEHDRQPWWQASPQPRDGGAREQPHPAAGQRAARWRRRRSPPRRPARSAVTCAASRTSRGSRSASPRGASRSTTAPHAPTPTSTQSATVRARPRRPRDAEVAPERGGPRAEPVAHGHGDARDQALQPGGPGQERGDERGREEPRRGGDADTGQHAVERPLRSPERGHQRALPHAVRGVLDERGGHDAPCLVRMVPSSG